MTFRAAMLVASLVSSGLIAGLFFGWTVSVIPGTAAVDDRTYITTMQNINREIINPAFIATFILTPAIIAVAAVAHLRAGYTRRGFALSIAAVTYLVGVMAVTAAGNVPLNNDLDGFDMAAATPAELTTRRVSYETPWNRWHNLRTLGSVATLAVTAIACTLTDAE